MDENKITPGVTTVSNSRVVAVLQDYGRTCSAKVELILLEGNELVVTVHHEAGKHTRVLRTIELRDQTGVWLGV